MTPDTLPFRDPQLDLETRTADLVARLTNDEKLEMLMQYQPAIERLGVAAYKHGTEAAHGIAWLGPATMFPQPLGLASTWDPELLERVGQAIGEEARGFYRRDPAKNGLTLWTPTVDLERDPRWGRTEEGWGEDPHLTSECAGALVRGMQGRHPRYLRSAATLKHFLANNHERDRGTVSATLDPRNLHEYYTVPFRRLFRAGAVSMMTAYNAVNGVPCNLHPLVKTAKDEWGCAFVVSDAGDVIGTNREHGWYPTLAEAVAANIRAGIDSITDDASACLPALGEALDRGLLTWAEVDAAVANSLRVRFRLGEFDPPGLNPYERLGEEQIGSPAHRQVAREAARASAVLLTNTDQTLPLEGSPRVALIGTLAGWQLRDWYSGEALETHTLAQALEARLGAGQVAFEAGTDHVSLAHRGRPVGLDADGVTLKAGAEAPVVFDAVDWGWSSTTLRDLASGRFVTTDDKTLRVEAREVFGWFTKEVLLTDLSSSETGLASWNARPVSVGADDRLVVGDATEIGLGRVGIDAGTGGLEYADVAAHCPPFEVRRVHQGRSAAVAAARQAEVAVVVVGNHPLVNAKETIDRKTLDLPPAQVELVKAVAAVNPKTVVVVVSSYPYALDPILPHARAILQISHTGPDLGPAVVDLLFGDAEPTGRLPMTWYRSGQDLPPLEDYDVQRGGRTHRWFTGQPLFPFGHGLGYSRFELHYLNQLPGPTPYTFEVTVWNTGRRAGTEVVQFYLAHEDPVVPRPRLQLVGFRRVHLDAGTQKTLTFALDPADLARWDAEAEAWVTDQGTVHLAVGVSAGDLRLVTAFSVAGSAPRPRDLGAVVHAVTYDDALTPRIEEDPEGRGAVTGSWLAYGRGQRATSPKTVEVRVRSRQGGQLTLRWGTPQGPVAAVVEVPAIEAWQTVSAPVVDWSENEELVLVPSLSGGRGEGVSWFRFLD